MAQGIPAAHDGEPFPNATSARRRHGVGPTEVGWQRLSWRRARTSGRCHQGPTSDRRRDRAAGVPVVPLPIPSGTRPQAGSLGRGDSRSSSLFARPARPGGHCWAPCRMRSTRTSPWLSKDLVSRNEWSGEKAISRVPSTRPERTKVRERFQRPDALDHRLRHSSRGFRTAFCNVVAGPRKVVGGVRRPADAHQPR